MSELKERIAGMSLDRRALLEERLLRANKQRWRPPTIPRRQPSDPAWLSFGQQQMWFLDQLAPGTSTYNIPDVMQVTGVLNVAALQEAFRSVIARHEVLRTRLGSVDGSPIPAVNDHWDFQIKLFDVTSLPEAQREIEAKRIIQEQARQPFNIAQDLMLRAAKAGRYLLDRLENLATEFSGLVLDVRGRGLMCAFSLPSGAERDDGLVRDGGSVHRPMAAAGSRWRRVIDEIG